MDGGWDGKLFHFFGRLLASQVNDLIGCVLEWDIFTTLLIVVVHRKDVILDVKT